MCRLLFLELFALLWIIRGIGNNRGSRLITNISFVRNIAAIRVFRVIRDIRGMTHIKVISVIRGIRRIRGTRFFLWILGVSDL